MTSLVAGSVVMQALQTRSHFTLNGRLSNTFSLYNIFFP
jgi:hypothetical protein